MKSRCQKDDKDLSLRVALYIKYNNGKRKMIDLQKTDDVRIHAINELLPPIAQLYE